jgi:hypothetical protein
LVKINTEAWRVVNSERWWLFETALDLRRRNARNCGQPPALPVRGRLECLRNEIAGIFGWT